MNRIIKYGALAIMTVALLGGCGGSSGSSTGSSSKPQSAATQSVKKSETVQQKALKDTSVPTEYRNALKKGISYATRMHMSQARVYQQLTSQYGEKFPPEAAQWAVEHMSDIDWNQNAAAKAKSYYEKQNMSKDRVYHQLVSDAGEKFTPEQAQYGVSQLK